MLIAKGDDGKRGTNEDVRFFVFNLGVLTSHGSLRQILSCVTWVEFFTRTLRISGLEPLKKARTYAIKWQGIRVGDLWRRRIRGTGN